jgi:preprotein translocase subunit Sss1
MYTLLAYFSAFFEAARVARILDRPGEEEFAPTLKY